MKDIREKQIIKGKFWYPTVSEEAAVEGTLIFTLFGKIELIAIAPISCSNNNNISYDKLYLEVNKVIWGILDNGEKVTLVNAQRMTRIIPTLIIDGKNITTYFKGEWNYFIRSGIYFDKHFDSAVFEKSCEQKIFRKLIVTYIVPSVWIDAVNNIEKKNYSFKYKNREYNLTIISPETLTIEYKNQDGYVEAHMESMEAIAVQFRYFLSFMLMIRIDFKELKYLLNNMEEVKFSNAVSFNSGEGEVKSHIPEYTCDNILWNIDGYFQEWLTLNEKCHTIIQALLDILVFSKRNFVENYLLEFISIFESLFNHLIDKKHIYDSQYKKLKKDLNKAIEDLFKQQKYYFNEITDDIKVELKKNLKSSLSHAHEYSLRKKIAYILDNYTYYTQKIEGNIEEIIKEIVRSRNSFVHNNASAEKRDGSKIFAYSRIIKGCIIIMLLSEIGYVEEARESKVNHYLNKDITIINMFLKESS